MKRIKALLLILFVECVMLAMMQRHAGRMSADLSKLVYKSFQLKTALSVAYNKTLLMPRGAPQKYGI